MDTVTAVMPTTEVRRPFWDGAIKNFLAQTFTNSELLILDESTKPAGHLSLSDRVKYVWMPNRGLRTGAKRNVINQMAQGQILIHFDDDDWYHPERIATQVAHLEETGQQVVGYHDLLYFRTSDRTLWAYYYQGRPPYACGTSMCYRRSWWEEHKFLDRSIGEDSEFSMSAATFGVLASKPRSPMIVARCHDRNTFKIPFGTVPFVRATVDMFPKEFVQEAGL